MTGVYFLDGVTGISDMITQGHGRDRSFRMRVYAYLTVVDRRQSNRILNVNMVLGSWWQAPLGIRLSEWTDKRKSEGLYEPWPRAAKAHVGLGSMTCWIMETNNMYMRMPG